MITDIFGWVGAVLILLAYYFVSSGKLKPKSYSFHSMNFIGAFGVAVHAFSQKAFPVMFLNVVWVLVSIYGIFKYRRI